MEVSLKKAAALSRAVLAAVPSVVYTRNLSPFDEPPVLDKLNAEMNAQIESTGIIFQAGYAIRNLVSKANEGRINELLCKRAACDAVIEKFKAVPLQPASSVAAVTKALEAAQNPSAPAPSYGRQPGIPFNLDTSGIAQIVSDAKREKTAIEDELSALNFTTKVKIPAEVEAVLKELNLI